MRYRNRNTGEERVTVDGSRLDKRVAADPDWAPVAATKATPVVADGKVGTDTTDAA